MYGATRLRGCPDVVANHGCAAPPSSRSERTAKNREHSAMGIAGRKIGIGVMSVGIALLGAGVFSAGASAQEQSPIDEHPTCDSSSLVVAWADVNLADLSDSSGQTFSDGTLSVVL